MMTATNADLHGQKTHQFLQYTNLEIMRITMDHANSLTYHSQAPQGCLRARIRTAHFDVCDLGDTRRCVCVELPSRLKEVENIYMRHTVDGSEIRLTSWYGRFAPLFNFLCRIWYIPGGCLGFLPSTVCRWTLWKQVLDLKVQGFFHMQRVLTWIFQVLFNRLKFISNQNFMKWIPQAWFLLTYISVTSTLTVSGSNTF